MAGVSSESLATALADLETKLPTASLSLADELFGILRIVDSSAGLRRALTDPSREGAEKSALVERLLAGKVSSEAVQIASRLASLRWADSRDVSDALETLAATVAIAVAEQGNGEAAGLGGLERLENDLFAFNRRVEDSHELQAALSEPQATSDAKRALALRLAAGASDEALLLIGQAAAAPRGLKSTELVKRFAALAATRQARWIAEVSVARPLSETQLDRLQAGLNGLYGRELKITTTVDPQLMGGVRVAVGDEVLDASTLARLADLRRQLAG
ncbi:F0F1 ATP synthase subunit delta [Sinomonas sp. ASV322]|uniref:F0F1 ATP synthase subunit delta n=1 Tax=Sinomonas sp. ASV322 TaxID=3041920 RepID=UPI0027DC349F|nr:F0F1 ATP synthase subunit delta [Sinomonas sp. ASV322]MDQ4502057.1 F0F1 ATP synthase subunit delta [Sinomonas sp. ASV322]